MPNLYEQFKALLPDDPQLIARVIEKGPAFSKVQYLGGEAVLGEFGFNGIVERVQGSEDVGTLVYIKAGVIVGTAPTLPVEGVIIYGL